MALFSPPEKRKVSAATAVWGCLICIVIATKCQLAAAVRRAEHYLSEDYVKGLAIYWPKTLATEEARLFYNTVLSKDVKERVYKLAPDAEDTLAAGGVGVTDYPNDTPLVNGVKFTDSPRTWDCQLFPTYETGVSLVDPDKDVWYFDAVLDSCKKFISTTTFTAKPPLSMFHDRIMTNNIANDIPLGFGIAFKKESSEKDLEEPPTPTFERWYHAGIQKDENGNLKIDITYYPTFNPHLPKATKRLHFSGTYRLEGTNFKRIKTVHTFLDKDFGHVFKKWKAQTSVTKTFENGELKTTKDERILQRHGFHVQSPLLVVADYRNTEITDEETGVSTATGHYTVIVDEKEELVGKKTALHTDRKIQGKAVESHYREYIRLKNNKTCTTFHDHYHPGDKGVVFSAGVFLSETDALRENLFCKPEKDDLYAFQVFEENRPGFRRVGRAACAQQTPEDSFGIVAISDTEPYLPQEVHYKTHSPLADEKLKRVLDYNPEEAAERLESEMRAIAGEAKQKEDAAKNAPEKEQSGSASMLGAAMLPSNDPQATETDSGLSVPAEKQSEESLANAAEAELEDDSAENAAKEEESDLASKLGAAMLPSNDPQATETDSGISVPAEKQSEESLANAAEAEQEDDSAENAAKKEQSDLASKLGAAMLPSNDPQATENSLVSRHLMMGGVFVAVLLMASYFLTARLRRVRQRSSLERLGKAPFLDH